MTIHLYTNQNPHIPTRSLGVPGRLVRAGKDVLQHGLRVGKAVVLLPLHLKQQMFDGGCKRWIDPSRQRLRQETRKLNRQKALAHQAQASAEATPAGAVGGARSLKLEKRIARQGHQVDALIRMVLEINADRLRAQSDQAGLAGTASLANPAFLQAAAHPVLKRLVGAALVVRSVSDPKDVAARVQLGLHLRAHKGLIRRVHAMERRLPPPPVEAIGLPVISHMVSLGLDAYEAGLRGLGTGAAHREVDFHEVTCGVLDALQEEGLIDAEHVEAFERYVQGRLRPGAPGQVFDPALPEPLVSSLLVRANVGMAWFNEGLVAPTYVHTLESQGLDPSDHVKEGLLMPDAIEAWYVRPPLAGQQA